VTPPASLPDRTMAKLAEHLGRFATWLADKYGLNFPRRTLRVPVSPSWARWHLGGMNGKPAMQIMADFAVTNITDQHVRVMGATLHTPRTTGDVSTKELDTSYSSNGWPIPPGETTWVRVHFWVPRLVCGAKKDLRSSVTLLDQFGNKHKVRRVRFRSDAARPPAPKPTEEKLSFISDHLEKSVASVLKGEKERFLPGSNVAGQFGTLLLCIAGHKDGCFGTEWHNANAPRPISIYVGPDEPIISSENADALLKLHRDSDSEGRSRVERALLSRLAKDTEYEYVGYFIMFVLHRLGRLQDGLEAAKHGLRGGKFRGFQNVLYLLDELLRYEHRSFPDALLDWIEAYAEGLEDYSFRIRDRICDIRTLRLKAGA